MKFKRLKLANEIVRREGTYKNLADKLGYTQVHIAKIVCCRTNGSLNFWNRLQEHWDIPNEEFKTYIEKTPINK